MKYTPKPVEAMQMSAESRQAIHEWLGPKNSWFYDSNSDSEMYVLTEDRSGNDLRDGEWVVKDQYGNLNIYTDEDFRHCFDASA